MLHAHAKILINQNHKASNMGILDNLENAWDANSLFESNPIIEIDNMGRPTIETFDAVKTFHDESPKKYLEPAMILLFNIEKRLRQHIAHQIESKFHGTDYEAAHEIAQFVKNMD